MKNNEYELSEQSLEDLRNLYRSIDDLNKRDDFLDALEESILNAAKEDDPNYYDRANISFRDLEDYLNYEPGELKERQEIFIECEKKKQEIEEKLRNNQSQESQELAEKLADEHLIAIKRYDLAKKLPQDMKAKEKEVIKGLGEPLDTEAVRSLMANTLVTFSESDKDLEEKINKHLNKTEEEPIIQESVQDFPEQPKPEPKSLDTVSDSVREKGVDENYGITNYHNAINYNDLKNYLGSQESLEDLGLPRKAVESVMLDTLAELFDETIAKKKKGLEPLIPYTELEQSSVLSSELRTLPNEREKAETERKISEYIKEKIDEEIEKEIEKEIETEINRQLKNKTDEIETQVKEELKEVVYADLEKHLAVKETKQQKELNKLKEQSLKEKALNKLSKNEPTENQEKSLNFIGKLTKKGRDKAQKYLEQKIAKETEEYLAKKAKQKDLNEQEILSLRVKKQEEIMKKIDAGELNEPNAISFMNKTRERIKNETRERIEEEVRIKIEKEDREKIEKEDREKIAEKIAEKIEKEERGRLEPMISYTKSEQGFVLNPELNAILNPKSQTTHDESKPSSIAKNSATQPKSILDIGDVRRFYQSLSEEQQESFLKRTKKYTSSHSADMANDLDIDDLDIVDDKVDDMQITEDDIQIAKEFGSDEISEPEIYGSVEEDASKIIDSDVDKEIYEDPEKYLQEFINKANETDPLEGLRKYDENITVKEEAEKQAALRREELRDDEAEKNWRLHNLSKEEKINLNLLNKGNKLQKTLVADTPEYLKESNQHVQEFLQDFVSQSIDNIIQEQVWKDNPEWEKISKIYSMKLLGEEITSDEKELLAETLSVQNGLPKDFFDRLLDENRTPQEKEPLIQALKDQGAKFPENLFDKYKSTKGVDQKVLKEITSIIKDNLDSYIKDAGSEEKPLGREGELSYKVERAGSRWKKLAGFLNKKAEEQNISSNEEKVESIWKKLAEFCERKHIEATQKVIEDHKKAKAKSFKKGLKHQKKEFMKDLASGVVDKERLAHLVMQNKTTNTALPVTNKSKSTKKFKGSGRGGR